MGTAITGIALMAFGVLIWVCGSHILEPLVNGDVYLAIVLMTGGPVIITLGGLWSIMLSITILSEKSRGHPDECFAQIGDVKVTKMSSHQMSCVPLRCQNKT